MKLSYKFIYIFSSFLIYVLLGLLDYLFLKGIINYFFVSIATRLIVWTVLLIVINTIITYICILRLPLKPELKTRGGINENMKRH